MAESDGYGREWIIANGIPIVNSYDGITLRALHYRLVSIGMPNTQRHYKRVISAMTAARWDGDVGFSDFDDHERQVIGETEADETDLDDKVEKGVEQVELWMTNYRKNRWENQPYYVEVWIEKKALQGTFQKPCEDERVALCPCKGYPSLTFLDEAYGRFSEHYDKECIILYFGDYDPSGKDIPRSIQDNLDRMGADVEVVRRMLMEDQVRSLGLPPAPTKRTDTRSKYWDGIGQVELDAIEPKELQKYCLEAIAEYFDEDLHEDLMREQKEEKKEYQKRVFEKVKETFEE